MCRLPLLAVLVSLFVVSAGAGEKPNLLLITLDDMNADSVGVYGCPVPETTPHIDAVARRGLRFMHAHVQVGNCMPGRNVMWSGLYPHNNRVEGFYQVPDAGHVHLVDLMNRAGYFTAIRGKTTHSTPYTPYAWDMVLDRDEGGTPAHPKDAASYGEATRWGIAAADRAGRPFCIMVNISDPHKPFYAQGRRGETVPDAHRPSRVFEPSEVVIPGFLFEDDVVRKEVAHYYSSVRRGDDCVGEVLAALEQSGQADETIVMLLSDHGMALPFAKTQVYHHSTHTPLIFCWPGRIEADSTDERNMVSAVDLLPTLAELADVPVPEGLDGHSFASLIVPGTESESADEPSGGPRRDYVIKEYNENAGGSRDPMRAVQTRQHLYIFNAWSDGRRVMRTATTGTPTYRRMAELAQSDPQIAARHRLYQHRVVEELYDVEADPDCRVNLIEQAEMQETADRLRGLLVEHMQRTGDGIIEVFQRRDDVEARRRYVQDQQRRSDERRGTPRQRRPRGPRPNGDR